MTFAKISLAKLCHIVKPRVTVGESIRLVAKGVNTERDKELYALKHQLYTNT